MNKWIHKRLFWILFGISVLFSLQFLFWPKKKEVNKKVEKQKYKNQQGFLVSNAEEAFEIRRNLIASAQSSIILSTYRFQEDQSSQIIFDDLYYAAIRGVKVEIIVDHRFGGFINKKLANVPNIHIITFNPPKIKNISGFQTVHHEKYLVVDGTYVIMGGRNYGNRFFNNKQGTMDVDVFIKGKKFAAEVTSHFRELLSIPEQLKYVIGKGKFVPSNQCFSPLNPLNQYAQRWHKIDEISLVTNDINISETKGEAYQIFESLFLNSKSQILISPYTTQSKHLLNLMNDRTTFYTNSIATSNNLIAYSNYMVNRHHFLEKNVTIKEIQSRQFSLHTKAYLFDDLLYVGSMNLDHRSFNINTETMVLLKSNGIRNEFLDMVQSYEAMSATYYNHDIKHEERKLNVTKTKKILMWITSIFSSIFKSFI